MGGSFLLTKIKGIKIRVHATFVLVLVLAAWEWGVKRGLGMTGALYGVVFTSLLFVCVTLHELAHSLVALRCGVRVRDIMLLPIGGLSRLESEVTRPIHEFWMAISGPVANLVLAGILAASTIPWLDWHSLADLSRLMRRLNGVGLERLLVDLMAANAGLGLFNLLPAFPLDGGRVLRALLASRLNELHATRIAMRIGQGMAAFLGLMGILTGAWGLILGAMFIFAGARVEWRRKQLRLTMKQVPASAALVRGGVVFSPHDPLARVIEIALNSDQADFAAFDRDCLVGVLTRKDVTEGFRRYGGNVPVERVMRTDFPVAQTGDTLLDLQHKMEISGSSVISVTESGHFLGLATLESVRKALQLFLQWGPGKI